MTGNINDKCLPVNSDSILEIFPSKNSDRTLASVTVLNEIIVGISYKSDSIIEIGLSQNSDTNIEIFLSEIEPSIIRARNTQQGKVRCLSNSPKPNILPRNRNGNHQNLLKGVISNSSV